MFQLRIYTLRTAEALSQYASVHWDRHVASFKAFGITTHGVWTERDSGANRLVALISYAGGADPAQVTHEFMTSPEFVSDMNGFNSEDIIDVRTLLLDPAPYSPIR